MGIQKATRQLLFVVVTLLVFLLPIQMKWELDTNTLTVNQKVQNTMERVLITSKEDWIHIVKQKEYKDVYGYKGEISWYTDRNEKIQIIP